MQHPFLMHLLILSLSLLLVQASLLPATPLSPKPCPCKCLPKFHRSTALWQCRRRIFRDNCSLSICEYAYHSRVKSGFTCCDKPQVSSPSPTPLVTATSAPAATPSPWPAQRKRHCSCFCTAGKYAKRECAVKPYCRMTRCEKKDVQYGYRKRFMCCHSE